MSGLLFGSCQNPVYHQHQALSPEMVSFCHRHGREPLCAFGVLPLRRWRLPPPGKALPSPHRSYGLMRQTKSLPPPSASGLVGGSMQVAASPCWEMALPDIISAILA